ncbi:MAG: pilus assembly protein PilP [Deltaproteobacteria bacterium]|nr:MAG: pilus assembly protein PilP [Gammaproteobacteria bacterium]TNE95313.1 MAG: pilus assembly protein PilP [Gammaproteobacteria bacterium]TNF05922.1 MAG: pilus assembly protein PilP [Deltaproteobacteria bacterium]
MAKFLGLWFVIVGCVLISGCAGDGDHQDLREFMKEVKARPTGEIDPIPAFRAYKHFRYSAIAMRSPFEPPLVVAAGENGAGKNTVEAPDESRKREYLEGFNFASLSMVGVLSKNGQMWALIDDGSGGIHRVTVGNYLGKNFGRIKAMSGAKVEVVEVVPDGKGSWVERPRTLALREKD